MEKTKYFYFSAIFWQIHREMCMKITQIEDILAESIKLSDFGTGVQKVIFVPMGVPKNDPIHTESVRFYKKTKKLEIYKRVSVDDLGALSLTEFLQEVSLLFYKETVQAIEKRKIKNFDVKAFKQAVEKLFTKKGWLILEQV